MKITIIASSLTLFALLCPLTAQASAVKKCKIEAEIISVKTEKIELPGSRPPIHNVTLRFKVLESTFSGGHSAGKDCTFSEELSMSVDNAEATLEAALDNGDVVLLQHTTIFQEHGSSAQLTFERKKKAKEPQKESFFSCSTLDAPAGTRSAPLGLLVVLALLTLLRRRELVSETHQDQAPAVRRGGTPLSRVWRTKRR